MAGVGSDKDDCPPSNTLIDPWGMGTGHGTGECPAVSTPSRCRDGLYYPLRTDESRLTLRHTQSVSHIQNHAHS